MTTIKEQFDVLEGDDVSLITELSVTVFEAMRTWPDIKVERMLAIIAVNMAGVLGPVLNGAGQERVDDLLYQLCHLVREQAEIVRTEMIKELES